MNLGLYGSSGKMGAAIEKLIEQDQNKFFTPFLAVGKRTSTLFAISVNDLRDVEQSVMSEVDVWIDFSSAEGLVNLLKFTQNTKTPVVSGSTGLGPPDFSILKKHSKSRPLFWASNLSPGLWTFRQAIKTFASIKNFDFEIDEIHHNQKKDQPSGTAKTLQIDVEKAIGRKINKPQSRRMGGVFGIHNVTAASQNEVITFQHQALNRSVFAEGALRAAAWLVKKKPALYLMDDMCLIKKEKGK